MSLNKVLLIGYVGNDPEIRYFDDNQCVASFNLALHRPAFRSKTGRLVPEQTDWIRISSRGEVARFAEEYVKKGSRLLLEGRLATRSYTDKQGLTHMITEVVAERISFVDSRNDKKSDDKTKI